MKYESKGEDRRQFQQQMRKIDKTNDILTELQRKMYSHFGKKSQQDHLLNSQDQNQQSKPQQIQSHQQKQNTKGKNTFKLFAKPNAPPMNINDLEKQPPNKQNQKQSTKQKTQMGQIIEQVETIQILVRKKLALKQQRIAQLEREISMQTEQKVHLYQVNCQLQQEIYAVVKGNRLDKQKQAQQQKMLEEELKRLTKVYEQKKKETKKIKQEEDLLKQTLKNSHNHRKGCLQTEIQSNKSREKLVVKQEKHQEEYLRGLVVELDRLKNMVRQKMKKQKSRLKFK